jgi:hypothetical protein
MRADRYCYRYRADFDETGMFLANQSLEIYLGIVRERVSAPAHHRPTFGVDR